MALRKEIKDAIRRDGKYIPIKVWDVQVDEPDLRDGQQGMTIYVSVVKRQRKRPLKKQLITNNQ